MIDANQNHLKDNPFISYPSVPCNTPSDALVSSTLDTFFSPSPVPFDNDPFPQNSGQCNSSISTVSPLSSNCGDSASSSHICNGLTSSQYPQTGSNQPLAFQTPPFSSLNNQTPHLPQTPSPLCNGLSNSLLPMFQFPLLCKSETMPPIVQNGGVMALCPPPPSSKCGRVQRRLKVNA